MLVVLAGRHAWAAPALPVETDRVALSWRAPEGCPDAAAVRARIGRLVGASLGPVELGGLRVDGVVTAVDGGFSLDLRVADGTAYFETSEDGVAWTIVASVPSPSDFVGASPLVMVWNNAGAGVSDPQPVVVDGWEICAD